MIIIEQIIKIISLIVPLLAAVAYFTLAERKIMASMQQRRGPNVVGFFGLLQPLADGLKLLIKETVLPSSANTILFIIGPIVTFQLSLMSWAVIPFDFGSTFIDMDVGVLYLLGISSLGVYGIITAGWASNSKYAFLGALRSAGQMISYEVSLGLIILSVLIITNSLRLSEIVISQSGCWFLVPLFPTFLMFLISALAETNRAPFDLPEAEGELVAGYNVEYSAMGFALFFLGEYGNMLLISVFTTILFLGGWLWPFASILLGSFFKLIPGYLWTGIKVAVMAFFFVATRAVLPRFRYDQLMYIGWKVFLPISLGFLLFISGYIFSFQLQVNNFYYLLSLEQIEIFLAQHTTYTDLVSTINGSER
jgi:NADH-quinone oxidoreductase subunit H